ncbi:hypothetical protein V1264_000237 [Littorina saxatilis]
MMCEDGRPYVVDPASGRRVCVSHLAPEGVHAHMHAGGALPGGLKSLASPLGSVMPGALDGAAFYNHPLLRGMHMRPERLAQCLTPVGHPMGFDPTVGTHPYGLLYAGFDVNGLGMRKAATRETTGPLKAWLHEHKKNPYPTKAEKIMLAIITKMTLTQVSTWFANARRRLKKENRLFTGRDTDNDDQDDDMHDKDDDDNDTDGTPKHLRDPGDSDEDINVDDSDISDNEDASSTSTTNPTTTTTTTTSSVSSPGANLNPLSSPSSSSLSPFPCTPPFHSHLIPRPGPMPVYPMHGWNGMEASPHGLLSAVPVPAASLVQRDSVAPKLGGALPNGSNSSRTSSSSRPSPAVAAAVTSRPKIWSISQIIHSDAPLPASVVSSAPVTSSGDEDVSAQRLNKGERAPHPSSFRELNIPSSVQRQDFLHHRLTSPFRTLESAEARLASRHASAFLVPGPHLSWVAPPLGLRLDNPCREMSVAKGNESGEDGNPDVGEASPKSEGGAPESGLQTEALDLQTKKEEKDTQIAKVIT